MEENTTLGKKKLPGFLKVLCIFSFVGIGIYIVTYVLGYMTLSALSSVSESISSGFNDPSVDSAVSSMDPLVKNGALYYILSLVACVLCLVGVIMMWKLKKTGFFIYLVGEVAPIILPFILLGGFGALGFFSMILSFIPIAFIIMYGLNYKHLS